MGRLLLLATLAITSGCIAPAAIQPSLTLAACSNWVSYNPPRYVWYRECVDGTWQKCEYEVLYCRNDPGFTDEVPTGTCSDTGEPCED